MNRVFYARVLFMSLACWTLFGVLTILAVNTAYLPGDQQIARWVQSLSWDPVAVTFPWISAMSGAGQVVLAVSLVVVVAIFDRSAVAFAVAGALAGGLYWVINLVVHKPRPVDGLVHVTEHPGAFAFPSGHATLATILVTVLVLTVGIRRFNRGLLALAAAVGVLVVAVVGIERIYVGAHYPSDVLGGILLAVSVLSLALSVRWIGAPVIERLGVVGAGHGNY